jgi:hypothetical protein
MQNGSLSFTTAGTDPDEAGDVLVRLGTLDDSTHGIEIRNGNGRTLFKVTSEDGQVAPFVNAVPVSSVGALVSGLTNGFRPGTNSASFVSLWAHEFWSVGDQIDYNIVAWPNAGNMDWQITMHEIGASAVVAIGPNNETSNISRSGTFTIPTSALVSGTDVSGRQMRMDIEARKNSGPTTVDVSQNEAPRNYS